MVTWRRQTERKAEGKAASQMRTWRRKSIQGFVVAQHVKPGKTSAAHPRETLRERAAKT